MVAYSEMYNILYIEDHREDGIPIMSPFTGMPLQKDFDGEINEDDPSLLFSFSGGGGAFNYVRDDISEYLTDEFYYEISNELDKNKNEEMSQRFIDSFKKVSDYLKEEFNIQSFIIIQHGGWNGMGATGYEHGYLDPDGKWYTLSS